jgi:hypothetical protein
VHEALLVGAAELSSPDIHHALVDESLVSTARAGTGHTQQQQQQQQSCLTLATAPTKQENAMSLFGLK